MYLMRSGYPVVSDRHPMGVNEFPPIGVRMKPVAGFGATDWSTEEKVIAFSLGGLLLAGLAWLVYKEVKIQEKIVETSGGEGLMKYQLGKAAGTLAYGLTRPDYRSNKKKRKHRRKSKKLKRIG